jgi:hypothetical protein
MNSIFPIFFYLMNKNLKTKFNDFVLNNLFFIITCINYSMNQKRKTNQNINNLEKKRKKESRKINTLQ